MTVERNIKLLTWFNFFTDFKLYAPIAIIYFTQVSGSFALGMSVFSVAMLSSAIFEVPTGILSDFIGRKKTIIFGYIYSEIVNIFALLFITPLSPFLMSLTSFFFGTGTVASNSLKQKEFTNQQRATMASLNSLAGSISVAVFSLVIGIFADKISTASTLIIVEILSSVTILLYWMIYHYEKRQIAI